MRTEKGDIKEKKFREIQGLVPLPTVSIAVFSGESILLLKRKIPPAQGYWSLPGGYVKLGEIPQETARRELYEETGISLDDALTLSGVSSFILPDRQNVCINFVVRVGSASVIEPSRFFLRLNEESSESGWFPSDRLPEPIREVTIRQVREGYAKLKTIPSEL